MRKLGKEGEEKKEEEKKEEPEQPEEEPKDVAPDEAKVRGQISSSFLSIIKQNTTRLELFSLWFWSQIQIEISFRMIRLAPLRLCFSPMLLSSACCLWFRSGWTKSVRNSRALPVKSARSRSTSVNRFSPTSTLWSPRLKKILNEISELDFCKIRPQNVKIAQSKIVKIFLQNRKICVPRLRRFWTPVCLARSSSRVLLTTLWCLLCLSIIPVPRKKLRVWSASASTSILSILSLPALWLKKNSRNCLLDREMRDEIDEYDLHKPIFASTWHQNSKQGADKNLKFGSGIWNQHWKFR